MGPAALTCALQQGHDHTFSKRMGALFQDCCAFLGGAGSIPSRLVRRNEGHWRPAPAQFLENIKNSPAHDPMAKGRRLLSVHVLQKRYIYQLSISQSFWRFLMISVVLILPKTFVFLFLLKGFCQIIKRRHTAASPAKGADIVPLVGIRRPGNIQMEPRKALRKALQE